MKPKRKWSQQQQAFIDECQQGTGSIVLVAAAGSGKTTTLEGGARALTARGKRVAIVAFNKKIARELKERMKDDRGIWAATVHSFGNRALKRALPALDKVEPDRKKLSRLFDERASGWVGAANVEALHMMKATIVKLADLAKQRAVIGHEIDDKNEWLEIIEHFDLIEDDKDHPLTDVEVARYARLLLLASNEDLSSYDYSDMIYLPLAKKFSFPKFDVVMIDEAQDTNPARREVVRRMLKPGGRVIAVGDPCQAIYGFTGADNDALDQIVKEWKAKTLPLSVTYRCPKAVVAFASQWIPAGHLTAHDSAPDGEVTSMDYPRFVELSRANAHTAIHASTAILCRNNAPLVNVAFHLIRNRIPCKIEGRDIADGLKQLAQRWKIKNIDTLEDRLDKHLERAQVKYKDKETKLAQITDQVETLRVIIDQCRAEKRTTIAAVVEYLDQLFADEVKGILTLCSIHKSKGLEWDFVYWLDRQGTCPSRFAKRDWQKQQEQNLQYVAATRAKLQLVDLTAPPKEHKIASPARVAIEVVQSAREAEVQARVEDLETLRCIDGNLCSTRVTCSCGNCKKYRAVHPRPTLSDTLEGVARQTPRVGAKQEPGRSRQRWAVEAKRKQEERREKRAADNVIERGTSSSHNQTIGGTKEDIDRAFAEGVIDAVTRAKLHKARRARERKQRGQ